MKRSGVDGLAAAVTRFDGCGLQRYSFFLSVSARVSCIPQWPMARPRAQPARRSSDSGSLPG
eukprot:6295306-Prymnesium_polylepis.1